MKYDKLSSVADEFINHEEILSTLEWVEANKENKALIESIITKAEKCEGIDHREAALLLACTDKELIEKMFSLARRIKQKPHRNVRTPLSIELLYQRMRLLSIPCKEPLHTT